jgi:preprotein translocase subunit Sec63
VNLIRLALLGVFLYLLWLRVRPHLKERAQLKGAQQKPSHPKEERLGGKLPHEILGVAKGADAEAVQSAYRRLVHEHHPDRSATLASDVQSEASDRTKAINWAYERLKKR